MFRGANAGAGLRQVPALRDQRGQALVMIVGAAAALIFAALLLTAIGGAVTGKARVQRAADLAALSGARAMRDDFDRLFAPARLANGAPNPAHLTKGEYLARAAAAAREAAGKNGVDPGRVAVRFPDAESFAPLRVRARIEAAVDADALPGSGAGNRGGPPSIPVVAHAVAEASPPSSFTGMPTQATGGGYSGPLVYRQGNPTARLFSAWLSGSRRSRGRRFSE